MSMWRNILGRVRPQALTGCKGFGLSRSMASKDFVDSPKCSKVDNGGCQNKTQCSPKSIAKPKKEKEEPFQFHHLLKQPAECCADPCPERFPTFDECLYKESDKAARKYQVTWVECPPIQIKPKKICCFEKGKRPPIPRRKRKEPKAKCEEEVQCPEEGRCPKITLPGCRPARNPARCVVVRKHADCVKVKAPYPSFSECRRPKPRPLRKVECQCLSIPSVCDVMAYRRGLESGGGRRSNCGKK
ncbi:uncharacterized protein Dwil_GK15752 [Drosophila willistoni]|uniref:Uncharacterized protein n=1 Tax=Drosophila willistoni TaxID=7260 RepID=B4MRH3_DROWI|nr:uncharacterized protein LOC6640723 [Drosophila willistoni]EDW74712.2 uncharacterized protein Dwil_GK15752 [Drosophila willistoni]